MGGAKGTWMELKGHGWRYIHVLINVATGY